MSQVDGRFIKDDSVTDAKLRLRNNQYLRSRNAGDSADINILRVNASDRIEFASLPQAAGTPSVANDLVNKGALDAAISAAQSGLDVKESVRVASVANVNIASAPSAIDGVTLSAGDRILLKDQTDPTENGIYEFNGAASALTRTTDADEDAEVTAGMFMFVEEGSTHADQGWVLTTNDPIVVDTTALTFTQFTSVGTYTAGDGIDISTNIISVDLAASGGLKIVSTELAVEPADFAGAGLEDDGSDNLRINVDATNGTTKVNASNELEALKATTELPGGGANGVLDSTDITNGYVDLGNVARAGSIWMTVSGVMQRLAVDFTVNLTGGGGGNTRVTFAGALASLVAAGDEVVIGYEYL